MGFYSDWKDKESSGSDISAFVEQFLKSAPDTIAILKTGDEAELQSAYDILQSTPLSVFIESLKCFTELPELSPAKIPCFSKWENGASRLNELLLFSPNGLTYPEIGYRLMRSKTDIAQRKYGENQAKFAAIMSLVELSTSRPIIVKETAWGHFLTRYNYPEKQEVLKKLMLRDACVQNLLCLAFRGSVKFVDLVPFLTKETQKRRKTNVKALVLFILLKSDYETVLSRINWDL